MGLHRPPFSIRVEQDFYYPFQSFEQRLTILQRLVQGKDFLILVIGEKGSGKTMLLKRFLASVQSDWRKCRILARVSNPNGRKLKLNNLDNHPAYILQDSSLPIVLFDDAHELSVIELQYLLKDALTPDSNRKLKRLVLFCEPRIKSAMADISTSMDSVTTINKLYMPGLNEKETTEYLTHRLGISGFRGRNPFKSSVVKSLHRASNGLPGFINLEAHKILQQKYSRNIFAGFFNLKNRTVKNIAGCIGILLLISIIFAAAGFYLSDSPFEFMLGNKIEVNDHPETATKTASAYHPEFPAKEPAIGKKSKDPEKPFAPSISNQSRINKIKTTPASNRIQSKKSPPLETPSDKAKRSFRPKKQFARMGKIYQEDWLLNQNSSNYTIQIIGVRKKDALVQFINQYDLPSRAKVAYYKTKYKGAPWFQAVYGIYPTRKDASTAIKNLPPEIHQLSPWIRRLSSVKSIIRNKKVR